MGYELSYFDGNDQVEVVGAASQVIGRIALPERAIAFVTMTVLIVRPSDCVTKAFSVEALLRRDMGGGATLLEAIPSSPNLFATAGDQTTLSGATIALFASADEFGVTIVTPAAMTLVWSSQIKGRILRCI